MSNRRTLVAILVDDIKSARELLDVLRTHHTNDNNFTLLDAVFAEKDEDGNISIHQTADMDAGRGALGGGVVGLIAGGLIFGPLGAVAGTAIGSVLAGVYSGLRDSGMNNRVMMNLARDMQPNQTTLILLIEGTLHPAASSLFRNYNTRLFYANLPVGAEDRLREVIETNTVGDTLREMETLRVRDEDLRRAYERDVPIYVVEDEEVVRDTDPRATPPPCRFRWFRWPQAAQSFRARHQQWPPPSLTMRAALKSPRCARTLTRRATSQRSCACTATR